MTNLLILISPGVDFAIIPLLTMQSTAEFPLVITYLSPLSAPCVSG
jgi:hypothetical protein